MSCIIPFEKCIARPAEKEKTFPLSTHLVNVKAFMEKRFEDDALLAKLTGLAGVCHDAAKAHPEWQQYIRNNRNRGPHHAPEGAFLFSCLAYKILKKQQKWEQYKPYWLWLTRDIADHHGALKKINDNHWIGSGQWYKMDLQGMVTFFRQHYPELLSVDISVESLDKWTETVFEVFEEAEESINLGYNTVNNLEIMRKLQIWRELTTALIAGDRFDAGSVAPSWFDKESHRENLQALEEFCSRNQGEPLSQVRLDAQRLIMKQLAEHPLERMYTLEMPTGYGKTVTALKMAAWLGVTQGYRKIVYVAPYLSILEQNSGVFEEAMGRRSMEHHSLAFLEPKNDSEEEGLTSSQLSVESWTNAVVCTSFQQWFKALFPGRAQDTLRRAFLKDSVVIIDEPQIISPGSWNVFLCGLEAVAEFYNLRVIFLSATMPPFHYGLTQEPVCLAVRPAEQIERYRVVRCGSMDEKQLARFLLTRNEKTQAAILNTIADAYQVYNEMKGRHKQLRLLHGMMAPLHKRVEIAKIKNWLKKHPGESVCVISTQIIEAGVDLSFEHVARALPVLPSAVQAAGRVNRHYEGSQGVLSLFAFLRGGEKNTRNYIYDAKLQKITDELLKQKDVWQESEMLRLIKDYYQKMFAWNTFEAGKQAIGEAYEGNWPELAKFQPFESDYFKLPVFVPWQPAEHDDAQWLPPKFVELQKRFNLYSAKETYQRYEDREYLASLPIEKRKEFMILFNHFVINVPLKLAMILVDKEMYLKNRIPLLENAGDYDPVSGLAKRHVEGYDPFI